MEEGHVVSLVQHLQSPAGTGWLTKLVYAGSVANTFQQFPAWISL